MGTSSTSFFFLLLLLLCAGSVAAQPATGADPGRVDLFVAGQGPGIVYPCFRQPALLAAGSTLLAFAEGRNVSSCAPPQRPGANEVGGLVLRRSTDGGRSWTPPVTIHSGNIDFYSLVHDPATGVVHLMLQEAGVLYFRSTDAGASWATPTPLHARVPPGLSIIPAVGHGIVVNASLCAGGPCRQAGRLVLPFVCTNTSASGANPDAGQCPKCHSCLLVSDDHGASWSVAGVGQSGSRECQVFFFTHKELM